MDEQILKIDAYIKRHLAPEEIAELESEIAQNPEMARQVARQRLHLEGLNLLLEQDLRTKMDAWEIEIQQDRKRPPFWVGLWIVVGILVVLGIYMALKPKPRVTVPEQNKIIAPLDTIQRRTIPKVPDSLSTPKPDLVPLPKGQFLMDTARRDLIAMASAQEQLLQRRGDPTDSVLAEGYKQLEQRHFKKAIKILQPLSDEKGRFALASAYFLDKQYAKAIVLFEPLASSPGFWETETAEYYAALCLWQLDQPRPARLRMTKIAEDKGHKFAKPARQWLEIMKK